MLRLLLDDYVKDADIVVTGEGRLDGQTVMGKAPIGVAKTAKKYGKKVIAFSGSVTKDAIACNQEGIDAFFPILRRIVTLEEAMDAALSWIAAQGLNPEEILIHKHAYNQRRAYRHGGKKF